MSRIAWFHEDDYCQVEVLPLDNWDHCARQCAAISGFAEAHRDTQGTGWTDVYVRGPEPTPLRGAGLTASMATPVLASVLPSFDGVRSGFGPYSEPAPRTFAFGPEPDEAIFFDTGEDGVIEHLWLAGSVPGMGEALARLWRLAPLLLVDWSLGELIRLDDEKALRERFPPAEPDSGGAILAS